MNKNSMKIEKNMDVLRNVRIIQDEFPAAKPKTEITHTSNELKMRHNSPNLSNFKKRCLIWTS